MTYEYLQTLWLEFWPRAMLKVPKRSFVVIVGVEARVKYFCEQSLLSMALYGHTWPFGQFNSVWALLWSFMAEYWFDWTLSSFLAAVDLKCIWSCFYTKRVKWLSFILIFHYIFYYALQTLMCLYDILLDLERLCSTFRQFFFKAFILNIW